MADVTIYLPERSEDLISDSLRTLTGELQKITNEGPYGLLGGEHGYGCDYENDVFMMHPFCWCEEPSCAWCRSCDCPNEYEYYSPDGEKITRKRHDDYSIDDYPDMAKYWESMKFIGEACRNCTENPDRAPNFLFKPTGAKVRWYKYIGRSMEVEGEFPADFLSTCLKSVAQ